MARKVLIYAVLRRLPEPASELAHHAEWSCLPVHPYLFALCMPAPYITNASPSTLQSYSISLAANEGSDLQKCA